MGFFSSITKPFTQVAKAVTTIVSNPVKAITSGQVATAIATGGVSLAIPKLEQAVAPVLSNLYNPSKVLPLAAGIVTRQPALALSGFAPPGGTTMGLNLGAILGQVGQVFGGGQNQAFQTVSNVANLASQFFPQAVAVPAVQRMPVPVPVPRSPFGGGGGAMMRGLGRSLRDKFPNLFQKLEIFKLQKIKMTRARLWGLLKRFGPDFLITAGILTAVEISELIMAGPGHRRMNAGNAKALRRSLRRIESFHHLCVRVDRVRGGRRRIGKKCATGATQFVRQG